MKIGLSLLLIAFAGMLYFSCNSPIEASNNDGDTLDKDNTYELVWSDEFNYKGLPDSTKWSYDIDGNSWGWGNNELQHYTAHRKENAWVDGEYLYIKATKEAWENKEYTSARLITKGKGDWLYGRFEIRAKLPSGRGTWPAIWMLPIDSKYGKWPKSGEIDIMEHVGYEPDSVYATAHTEAYNHSIGTHKNGGIKVNNCESEFHNYIVEWNEHEFRAYMDTSLYFTFKNENKTYKEWPFDKHFYLLLNLAVGGNWGAIKGIDDAIFPQEMVVDYVRVYQKNN